MVLLQNATYKYLLHEKQQKNIIFLTQQVSPFWERGFEEHEQEGVHRSIH